VQVSGVEEVWLPLFAAYMDQLAITTHR